MNLKISGISSIPQFYIPSKKFLEYRSFITQEFLKKNMLASNIIYVSTFHKKKEIDLYLKHLKSILAKIKDFEKGQKIRISKIIIIKKVFRKNN